MTSERQPAPLPEELLSGYLDGALTQQDDQRVRLYLERSAAARTLLEEMRTMRQATMRTSFDVPEDDQWREAARTPASRLGRRFGLALLLAWILGVMAFGTFEMITGGEDVWHKILSIGGLSGALLVFLSVLVDRLRDRRTDRYRGVLK